MYAAHHVPQLRALNYKGVPYKTVFLSYPDIEGQMRALGAEPGYRTRRGDLYT